MFHVHLGIERKPVTSSRFRRNQVLDYCLLITTTPNFPILAYMRPKEHAGQFNGICVFMTFDIWLHPADFGACHMVKELIKGEKTCFQEKKICYRLFTTKPCHLLRAQKGHQNSHQNHIWNTQYSSARIRSTSMGSSDRCYTKGHRRRLVRGNSPEEETRINSLKVASSMSLA